MPKSKILIADDNVPNVELLEAYLDGLDCETAVAVDCRDTLAKVAEFQPDLILLDIMMPKLSGFEVCKTLKRNPHTRQIMILMVTALNELGDIERAVAAGCDDFLSKPVNKLELVKRVENMLKLRQVTDELERLRATASESGKSLHVVRDSAEVSRLMLGADFVVTSPGNALFETFALAVPSLAFFQNASQEMFSGFPMTHTQNELDQVESLMFAVYGDYRSFRAMVDALEVGRGRNEIADALLEEAA